MKNGVREQQLEEAVSTLRSALVVFSPETDAPDTAYGNFALGMALLEPAARGDPVSAWKESRESLEYLRRAQRFSDPKLYPTAHSSIRRVISLAVCMEERATQFILKRQP
jgi:hypothetical protein